MAELRVLGPMELWVEGQRRELGPGKQRAVLAALLVDVGRAVPVETLIERVWDAGAPAGARSGLYSYVTRLRRVLPAEVALRTCSDGYVLRADADLVDLHRMRRLVSQARDAVSDDKRVELLGDAMALWRGQPLAGLAGGWVERVRQDLRRQRLDLVVQWAQVSVRLGRPGTVIDSLRELLAEHPLVEPVTAELMRALYLDGHAAEALECYRTTRLHLVDELGAEPGIELQQLHQAILRGDLAHPGRSHNSASSSVHAPREPVPQQLPPDVYGFTGRTDEIARLDHLLSDGHAGRAAIITAIAGTAGVGKTALAVHWAHRVRGRFADGQLYANMRGFDPTPPLHPADALARFLHSLGVAPEKVPTDVDEAAALYRSLLADKRMLVVLDNAINPEQVRPLLPASPGSLALITSRDTLGGLVARDGARRINLDVLAADEAVRLLAVLLGQERNAADGDATAELARLCGYLPLALRIAAANLSERHSIADYVERLATGSRLAALAVDGEEQTAVRAAFDLSYAALPPLTQRTFRLLGLVPGADFGVDAAAALSAISIAEAQRQLDRLIAAHLLDQQSHGRYAFHDLLRIYAAEHAVASDVDDTVETDVRHETTQAGRLPSHRGALTRLFDHYLHSAALAMDILRPAERSRRPRIAELVTSTLPMPDAGAARAWLDTESVNLIAAIAHAASDGWPDHATRLAITLFSYFRDAGRYDEVITIHTYACRAARESGDRAAEAHALTNLGHGQMRRGRRQDAANKYQQALRLFQAVGDLSGEARVLGNLSVIYQQSGPYQCAADYAERALGLYRKIGNQLGEAIALSNVGNIHARLSRYDEAAKHYQQALVIHRQIGDQTGEAFVLGGLGFVHERMGNYSLALNAYQCGLTLGRDTGERFREAHMLTNLGVVYHRLGGDPNVVDLHQQALRLFRDIGAQGGEAGALNNLGDMFLADGDPAQARSNYVNALALATEVGDSHEQARAHNGLGHAHDAEGAHHKASSHWEDALAIYRVLGVPEADEVREHLSALSSSES